MPEATRPCRTSHALADGGLERVSAVARYLAISRSQVYRLIEDGTLPSVMIGKSRRIPVGAVLELAGGVAAAGNQTG